MKKRFAVLMGACALTMAALCGCGATTEKIVDKMFDQETESFAMTMDMDVDVSAGVSGMSVGIGASGTVEAEVDNSDEDAPATHMTMDMKVSVLGSSEKVKTESYIITDDKEVATYMKDPDSGDWTLSKAEVEENPLDKKTREAIIDEFKDVLKEAELDKKTVKKEGEDCYVLRLNTTGDALEGVVDIIWNELGDAADELKDAGADKKTVVNYLSYLNFDTVIYSSKKTGKLVAFDLDMAESDTDGLIKAASKDFGDMASAMGVDVSSVSVDIDALSFSFVFSDWGEAEVSLPKDVKNNAVEAGGLFGGDDDGDDWMDGDGYDNPVDGDGYDNNTGDGSGDNSGDNSGDSTSTASTDVGIKENADGSVTLYSFDNNPVADVYAPDGYKLSKDFSSENSIFFLTDSWSSSIMVCNIYYPVWAEVIKNGEQYEDEGYNHYLVQEGDNLVKLAFDLGYSYDGYEVYGALEGEFNSADESIDNGSYYIIFQYDDDWGVSVILDPEIAKDWEEEDYVDMFRQMFE